MAQNSIQASKHKIQQLGLHAAGLLRGLIRRSRRQGECDRLCVRFCYPDFGASTRYRVDHQREQATIAGLDTEAVLISDGQQLYDLSGCDLLYLYRMPLGPRSAALLIAARSRHIPVIFDSDDLVWDERMREYEHLDKHYDAPTIARILRSARRTGLLMRQVDALVMSTDYLAAQARLATSKPVYVNMNAVSREMAALSVVAQPRQKDGRVLIGYFSGYPRVHDEDIDSVGEVLASILKRYPQVVLRMFGELNLPGVLQTAALAARIERRAVVDWRVLPQEIAQMDLTIAPLIDNPQRRSKSAVKYLESGLCGVPVVASRLEPYTHVIRDGQTSLLASTASEWEQSLGSLVEDSELRRRLGEQARVHILAEHTTDVRAVGFGAMLREVAG